MAVRVTGKPKRGALPSGGTANCRTNHALQVIPAAVCFPLAQLPVDPVLLVIGSLIIIGFMLMRFQKRTSRSNAAPAYRPSRPTDKAAAGRAERKAIDNWEVQMHELARELTGRVDTKLAALQQLLLMIDERMAALDEKLARLDATLGALPEVQRQATPPAASSSAAVAKVSHESAGETASAKLPSAEPTSHQGSTAAESGEVD